MSAVARRVPKPASQPWRLRTELTVWFAAAFFLLYSAAAVFLLGLDARDAHRDVALLLQNQAENLASYLAASGRLDYPELRSQTTGEIPFWLRVVDGSAVVAETPGFPDLRPDRLAGAPDEEVISVRSEAGSPLLVVVHRVWNSPGRRAEAVASLVPVRARSRTLFLGLALTGLLLVPLAGLGGRLLARRASRPIERLISATEALDSNRLSQRLEAPGATLEIVQLTEAFNRLLGRLETSVERMRRFTADASHELRTPVSILKTGIQVALRRPRPAAEYAELLAENLAEIDRLQRIVEGLLTLAQEPQEEMSRARKAAVVLADVVRQVVANLGPRAAEKRLDVRLRLDPSPVVLGNEDLLRLMVTNLLDNAIRHSPAGEHVAVSIEAREGSARLTVSDHGPGVAPDEREHVFERFFRGRDSRRAGGATTGGLGLSVVRWVAGWHGGTAELADTEGGGATFLVDLPLTHRRAETPAA